MLFEESGMMLTAGEQVVIQGRFKGKVPEGIEMKTGYSVNIFQLKTKQKVQWKEISGELVLTNRRAIALNKEGTIRKKIITYEFGIVGAIVKKPLLGKEKLDILLNVGKPQSERTELEVDNPIQWVNKIKEVVSQRQN